MNQKLLLVTGSPCVGKFLYESFDNITYLDGDWVWHIKPFSIEEPRLIDGDKNMSLQNR